MNFNQATKILGECAKHFYARGWALGTSGNFSAVIGRKPFKACISASGNDKGALSKEHFLEVDDNGAVLKGIGNPSAETLLHLMIYNLRKAGAVFHTHSVWGTVLTDAFGEEGSVVIEGYEMLKGLAGVETHEHKEILPIVENSQDYPALSSVIESVLHDNPGCHGIYIRRHGLYTWGKDISEAKRHIEIFEFLFEVLGRELSLQKNAPKRK